MDCWEDRMAHRAAVRRGLREAEAWANDGEAPTVGGCGFEMGTASYSPALPSVAQSGDMLMLFDNGGISFRIVGDDEGRH